MLKVIQRLMLILVAVLSLGASAGWQRLGRLDVGLPADHDVLSVSPRVGPVRELMLEARGDAVDIREMYVNFDDGTTFKPENPIRVPERSKGEVISLEGKRRKIRDIGITYAPANGKENVQLTVYGR
jgi:hypothetical protein